MAQGDKNNSYSVTSSDSGIRQIVNDKDVKDPESNAIATMSKEQEYKFNNQLDAIGAILSKTRSEAIEARQQSGIEDDWLEDEEYYEGIDDANRRETKSWRGKPLGTNGVNGDDDDDDNTGSTIFLNITRPYVDATSARMADMLLPADELSFKIKPTPRPELLDLAKGKIPTSVKKSIEADSDDPEVITQQTEQAIQAAVDQTKKASEIATKIETQIRDWHIESEFQSHNRRVIEDASKVGSGVLKGPVPAKSSKMIFKEGKLQLVEEVKPVSVRILYRNLFPDPACGENIHNGNFIWERDDLTRTGLTKLSGLPGYIDSQIAKCLEEGPMIATKDYTNNKDTPGLRVSEKARKSLFEIWYYYGAMKYSDLATLDVLAKKFNIKNYEDNNPGDHIYVQVTMVNNRVIKASVSSLQTGKFPYDIMIWQRRMGMPWGIGVARQIRPAQRIIVGAMRHMMDNAGIAGGPMLYINDSLIQPADGINEIKPWKVYISGDDIDPNNIPPGMQNAIQFIKADMIQEELQAIIELGMRMAEDITGLPLIMQGQTSQKTPATLGGMQLQHNNASTVLRRVARLYDDMLTKPHIIRYYDHILQFSDDDSLKGEFTVEALGSSALIERDIANQALIQLGASIQNPIFKKDPAKWINEVMRTNKLDPTKFDYDDEQWQQIVENMTNPPPDPRLEVEQVKGQTAKDIVGIKAEAEAKILELQNQMKQQGDDKDRQVTVMLAKVKTQEAAQANQVKQAIAAMTADVNSIMTQMKESGANERQLQVTKQKLQDTVLKLQTQISLSGTEVSTPPVEPKGRASDGKSYQE